MCFCKTFGSQRAYSIRTRIKTQNIYSCKLFIIKVREHIPLEQGLRHLMIESLNLCEYVVREHIPLEQGLRHPISRDKRGFRRCQRAYSIRTRIKTITSEMCNILIGSRQRAYSIRTRIKTVVTTAVNGKNYVREHIPLEQGLRRRGFIIILLFKERSESIFH